VAEMTAMTIRLPAELAEDIHLIAECDGEPTSEAIRSALYAWVEQRRKDPAFQEALRNLLARGSRLLADGASR
jgi:Arc/MetJ-type ribon-helix-helix transcriptional regulator